MTYGTTIGRSGVNRLHRYICASEKWRTTMTGQVLPWALRGVELGGNLLEVGPGPGITTDALRTQVERMTAVEIDPALAAALQSRMANTNVTVLHMDAAQLPRPQTQFDSAACFTMLHHVPSPAAQDALFARIARVLKPGGTFVGIDSLPSLRFRLVHLNDTMTLVDPDGLPARLAAAGFTDVTVEKVPGRFRFSARAAG
jgi:ubiquinone/menaquinone biosynthesis C-methylase UbiE